MPTIIHKWKSFELQEEEYLYPNNRRATHTTVKHPGAVVIIAVDQFSRIAVLNQLRPSINEWILELPAGTKEQDESVLECAKRELEEETGYSAKTFTELGELIPAAGFCDEVQYMFVATELKKTQRLECDDDEFIEVNFMALDEIESLIRQGKICDAKTIAALSKARLMGLI